jgi:hypothetical protein
VGMGSQSAATFLFVRLSPSDEFNSGEKGTWKRY